MNKYAIFAALALLGSLAYIVFEAIRYNSEMPMYPVDSFSIPPPPQLPEVSEDHLQYLHQYVELNIKDTRVKGGEAVKMVKRTAINMGGHIRSEVSYRTLASNMKKVSDSETDIVYYSNAEFVRDFIEEILEIDFNRLEQPGEPDIQDSYHGSVHIQIKDTDEYVGFGRNYNDNPNMKSLIDKIFSLENRAGENCRMMNIETDIQYSQGDSVEPIDLSFEEIKVALDNYTPNSLDGKRVRIKGYYCNVFEITKLSESEKSFLRKEGPTIWASEKSYFLNTELRDYHGSNVVIEGTLFFTPGEADPFDMQRITKIEKVDL